LRQKLTNNKGYQAEEEEEEEEEEEKMMEKQKPCIEPALALGYFNLPLSFLYSFLIQIFALETKLSPFPFEID
jgi:CO dehydrogenase/acetyl-CoA synthase beta subunit